MTASLLIRALRLRASSQKLALWTPESRRASALRRP